MVNEKLYINGVALDMGDDSINLTYESNFFGAVDSLKMSFSYTFTLPRTVTNDSAFEQAYDPATGCDILRNYFPCEYERDGVAVVRGSLCVNSVNASGYNCCLVFGLDALKDMSEEKLKLWQLPQGTQHQNDVIQLSSAPTYSQTSDFTNGAYYGFARYYCGMSPDMCRLLGKPAVLPCVNVRYILNLIYERYRVSLRVPADRETLLNKMVIALTGGKVWREGMQQPRGAFTLDKNYSEQYGYEVELLLHKNANGAIYQKHDPVTDKYYFTASQNITLNGVRIELTNTVQFNVTSPVFGYRVAEYVAARGLYVAKYELNDVAFNAGDDFALTLAPHTTPDVYPHTWLRDLQLEAYEFDVKADGQGIRDGAMYFIPANLPDITAIEFIKEICAFLGVVPVRVSGAFATGNVIECATVDEVITGDVEELNALGIEEITPHFKDYAQANFYRFATNEYQMNDHAAAIECEDKTAALSKDLFTSYFAAIMGANEIPLFTVNDAVTTADLTVTDNSIKDVLCVLDVNDNPATLTQSGLTWATLLDKYYATKREILRAPVVVSVSAMLSPVQVQQLDAARCVYVPVLGAYYLPLRVETDGDAYKFELIRLTRGTQPTPPPDPETIIIRNFEQYLAPSWIDATGVQNKWATSGAYHTGVIIPITRAEEIKLKVGLFHGIKYALLADIDNIGETGTRPHYSTGYSAPVIAQAAQETTITRDADANYLYFERVYDGGYVLPEYIKIIGNVQPEPVVPVQVLTDEIRADRYQRYISDTYSFNYASDSSYSVVIPVTIGKTYRIAWDTTDEAQVSTIFRYGFINTLPPKTGGSNVQTIAPRYRGTPQQTQVVEITASGAFLCIQVGGSTATRNLSHLFVYEL